MKTTGGPGQAKVWTMLKKEYGKGRREESDFEGRMRNIDEGENNERIKKGCQI